MSSEKDSKAAPSMGRLRLNRYIALCGVCNRREADELISAGRISVNGEVVRSMGIKIDKKTDVVRYDETILIGSEPVYLVLNKPRGFRSKEGQDGGEHDSQGLIKHLSDEETSGVGEMGVDECGLLLFTNDKGLMSTISKNRKGTSRLYHVFLDKAFTDEDLARLKTGMLVDSSFIKIETISHAGPDEEKSQVGIQLRQDGGIVTQLFESLGYSVEKLDRVMYCGLSKKDLPRGKARLLSRKEIGFLKMLK